MEFEKHKKLTDIQGIALAEYRAIKDAKNAWVHDHFAYREYGIDPQYVEVLKAKGIRDLRTLEPRNLAKIEGIGKRGAQQIQAVVDDWHNAHGLELWRVSARVWALTDMDYAHFRQRSAGLSSTRKWRNFERAVPSRGTWKHAIPAWSPWYTKLNTS